MRGVVARAFRIPLAVAVLVMSAACDNPVEPDDHPEAGGVVILDASSGAVLAMSVGANTAFNQQLTIGVSETLEVEIKFLNADSPSNLAMAFFPDASEGESLRVTIANEAIVEYDDHGNHGDFEAKAVGQTTAQFELMHGGHADFRSGLLTIVVE